MGATSILTLQDLRVEREGKMILDQLSLSIGPGELHGLIGPNGAGKSTLGHFLAGRPGHKHSGGDAVFLGKSLLATPPQERAQQGLFLAFQQPVAIPGVQYFHFLHMAINQRRKALGETPLSIKAALSLIKNVLKRVGLSPEFLQRSLNDGFSGGEQKRSELLQMILLPPKIAIIDEVASGLDLAARRLFVDIICEERAKGVAFLMITHHIDLLQTLEPDRVHVMKEGRIMLTGGPEVASQARFKGYENL